MNHVLNWAVGLALLAPGAEALPPKPEDSPRLREMLYDRQHPHLQSQAALLLVMSKSTDATDVVRQALQQTESTDAFFAISVALRLRRDGRFNEELFKAVTGASAERRHAAAEALSGLVDNGGIQRLKTIALDSRLTPEVRQTAIHVLGKCGRKAAVAVLLDVLASEQATIQKAAVEALTALTGNDFGTDSLRWQAWWDGRKALAEGDWLEERFLYQVSKARRLEGEVERARGEVIRLQQQLYARLPGADRIGHVQATMAHEDAAVRVLVVAWCVELYPQADAVGQRSLTEVLLEMSRDGTAEVQRRAVLALGRLGDPRVCARLKVLLQQGPAAVRAAAARALTQHATLPRVDKPETARQVQREVVPALQKALEDPALEVVVEAAEDLGGLGVPEAVPVLSGLLRHPSEPVRQTAAQALERVADVTVLDDLLAALDESAVTVRFSIVGALGHVAGDGRSLTPAARARLLARLEDLLVRDVDPGVRSRAASVLGEWAPPSALTVLWKRVVATEDSRVQDKAWAAFSNVLIRAANLELLTTWERTLADARQEARHVQLLAAVVDAWKKSGESRALLEPAMEALIQTQLQQRKWPAAFPIIRELLAQPGSDADVSRRLRWLLTAAEQALSETNKDEALRAVQDAQTFLPRCRALVADFNRLEKQARQK